MIPATILLLIGAALLVRGAKPIEPPVSYDCDDEGFFPHPKDCRKYFWCLDSGPANLGIVPHHFTCPSGLYFNTKTEACDYPANVPCASDKKNKTLLTRSRSRKKSTSTTTEAPADAIDDEILLTTLPPETTEVVTTTPATSTTTTTTTKAPSRLLKEAGVGRQRRPVQATSPTPSTQQEDNLKQLLHLVQSLGGVERIKTLVNDKDTSVNNEINHRESERVPTRSRSNSRTHQTTPPSFFSPSYETPRRQETVTETPNVLASNQAPSNQIRHRRPQFDQSPPSSFSDSSSPVTVNPFLSYADPSRGTAFDSEPVTDAPAIDFRDSRIDPPARPSSTGQSERVENSQPNFYSFSYHTPGSRVSVQGQSGVPLPSHHSAPAFPADPSGRDAARPAALSLPANSPFNDPFFNYNTPGRFGPQSTHAVETTASVTTVTEPSTSTSELPVQPVPPSRGSSGRESSRQRQANRNDSGFVRVRVNPGGNLRLSEPGAHQGSSGRRATRVRIANPSRINPGNLLNQPLPPAVASAPVPVPRNRINHNSNHHANSQSASSSPPGVLYDEDRELHHISDLRDVSRSEVPAEIVTTRRPARRRPPQREHLRNRQEDNPVGALVNLPPPNLQLDPSHSFPAATGHGGIGRPFPPRPQTLPPQPFTGSGSLPRILPIAVPLVTLPPREPNSAPAPDEQPVNNPPSPSYSSSFNYNPSDSGFRPGTVRYSNLNLPASPTSSPRPQFDDLFVTDFPFFGDNAPQTLPPSAPQRPATSTSTTTTTTTTTPAPTTEYVPPSTRRQRQRQRRPTAATIAPFNETPRPTRRREVTTALPLEESPPPQPSGPPVEMESGLVKCTRRGVFAHPGSCGQFVVCAPASRGSLSYRSYMHHCPAEQVFVEEVGRCRPGNKEKCEVFTR